MNWLPWILLLAGGAGEGPEQARELAGIVDQPTHRVPLVTVGPQYPKRARRDRIEGETTICFTIDAAGNIRRPKVESSSDRMFRKPAMKAIRQSSFEPAQPGQELSTRTCRTYRFLLQPVESASAVTPLD